MLVEPVPESFELLKQNYRHIHDERLTFLNAAVSDSSAPLEFYRINPKHREVIPSHSDQVASFSKEHLIKHFPDLAELEDPFEVISIQTVSMNELLLEYREGGLDVLVMDVEGYESILLHSIDYGSVKPKLIVFESVHQTDLQELNQFLSDKGYQITALGGDSVAVLPE